MHKAMYQSPKQPVLAIFALVALMFAAPFLHIQYLHMSHHWRFAPKGVYGENGMVVSAHRLASEVGRDVLREGGNAFDGAVAVSRWRSFCKGRRLMMWPRWGIIPPRIFT